MSLGIFSLKQLLGPQVQIICWNIQLDQRIYLGTGHESILNSIEAFTLGVILPIRMKNNGIPGVYQELSMWMVRLCNRNTTPWDCYYQEQVAMRWRWTVLADPTATHHQLGSTGPQHQPIPVSATPTPVPPTATPSPTDIPTGSGNVSLRRPPNKTRIPQQQLPQLAQPIPILPKPNPRHAQ